MHAGGTVKIDGSLKTFLTKCNIGIIYIFFLQTIVKIFKKY